MSERQPVWLPAAAVTSIAGLLSAMLIAPSAVAEPCTGAVANAMPPQPLAASPDEPAWPFGQPPLGHRPRNADENAPTPSLGRLGAILQGLSPNSARVNQQAAVVPRPTPGTPSAQQPTAQQPAAVAAPAPPAVSVPAPDLGAAPGTSLVGWVTGLDGAANTLQRFGISGTDLGIMWDNGDAANRQVLMAFGDTYGYCGVKGQQWRYNALFRTQDRVLAKGIQVGNGSTNNPYGGAPERQSGYAKQIINTIKWAPSERGIIPTAGVSVGRTQYLNFMSIRSWDDPGSWTTNFSAIAVSNDNGQNWGVYPGTVRIAAPDAVPGVRHQAGNQNFQQGAFLKAGDGYVYNFGTPAGRDGAAYLSRVPQGFIPDLTKYEYWNGSAWVAGDPAAATPVIPGPVGEMSAQYNTYLKQFLVMYGNEAGDVLARTAPAPQGPWSPETRLVSASETPGGAYAPYLHPWSTGKELYFNLSLWSAYNVMLMKTVLP